MTESQNQDLNKPALPMNIQQIREYLPHRYPFLLVDRVTEITDKYERHEELHTIQAIAELDSALIELQKLKCITS